MEKSIIRLGTFIASLKYRDLPEKTRRQAKERLIDILSAALAGSLLWEHSDALPKAFAQMDEAGNTTIVGKKETTSFTAAAAINSAYSHSVELDDGHRNAGVHAGAVVIPTVLSIAERFKLDGMAALTAIVTGYDIAYRVAANMCPSMIKKGFHPSAICGTVGAAAAASSLMRLPQERCANAIALSTLFASGLMEVTHSGQASKGAMVGQAAQSGIHAAVLAANGFNGPEKALSGCNGFFAALSSDSDPDTLIEGIGERYLIEDTYVKLYPTCRHTHPPIEAIAALAHRHRIRPQDVKSINIGTFPIAFELTGRPGHPSSPEEARFSSTYCAAVAILKGSFGLDDLKQENIDSPARKQLGKLVTVHIDEGITAKFPKLRGAKVDITLKDGKVYEKIVYDLKGSPEFPVGYEELCEKFREIATPILEARKSAEICDLVANIENCEDLSCLMKMTIGASEHEKVA